MSERSQLPPHDFETGGREATTPSPDYERRQGEPGVNAGSAPRQAAMPAPRTRGSRIRPVWLPLIALALAVPAAAAFALLGPAAGLAVIGLVAVAVIVLAINSGPDRTAEGVREYDPDRPWPTDG